MSTERETRYAEALRRADDEALEGTNFGRLTATYEWSTAATAFWAGSSADVAPAAVLTKVVAKVAAVLDKHTGEVRS